MEKTWKCVGCQIGLSFKRAPGMRGSSAKCCGMDYSFHTDPRGQLLRIRMVPKDEEPVCLGSTRGDGNLHADPALGRGVPPVFI